MGLIFLDGDFKNRSEDNLMEVSVDELKTFHKMNHEKLSADYVKSIILKIRLENKVKELVNDHDTKGV